MIAAFSLGWLIEALLASGVLMIVVLLLRGWVRRAFGADMAYALWLLPVLRLVLPPLPAAWHPAAVAPVLRATEQMTILLAEPVDAAAAAAPLPSWLLPALALAWGLGVATFVLWHTFAHHRFCRRLLDHAVSSEERDGVHVIESSAANGPLAFGVLRRYIAFPHDFAERFDPEERDLALAHELGHHARGDLIANWIALVVLALHWFNPIAWRAFRAFRADQEIANDARVLAGMNPMRRHTYACAILKAAHPTFLGGTVSATCHLHTIDDLKGRLRMLTTTKISRARLIAGSSAIAALTLGGLALTASGSQAAERMRSDVARATGVDLAQLMPPTPAAPTTPPDVAAAALPAPETTVPPEDTRSGTTVVTISKDGKSIVRHGRYLKLHRDGSSTLVGEVAAMPPMPPVPATERMVPMAPMAPQPTAEPVAPISHVPEMASRTCGRVGPGDRMVIQTRRGDVRQIIVCTDRIAAAAARGAAIAANSKDFERNAYARALDGLRAARARMTTSDHMTDAARRAALAGMDVAILEVEADLAKAR